MVWMMTMKKRSAGDHRQRDPEELAHRPPRPRGGLVQVARHVLERGQEDDHRAVDAPECHQHDRRLDPGRVEQPLRVRRSRRAQPPLMAPKLPFNSSRNTDAVATAGVIFGR